jgi:cell division septation protein DedD
MIMRAMSRTVFLLLVLLNIAAFAWIMTTDKGNEGREPQRAAAQYAVDKIRIAPPDEAATIADAPPATQVPTAAGQTCSAIMLALADAEQLKTAWVEKLPQASVSFTPVPSPPVFDVAIAGLASRAAAEAKLAELRKIGFKENLEIVAGADNHYSVLIASFPDKARAEEGFKSVTGRGVRSASLVVRQAQADKATVEVRGTPAALQKLPELMAAVKNATPASCATP